MKNINLTILGCLLALLVALTPLASAEKGDMNYIGSIGVAKAFEKYAGQDVDSIGLSSFHMLDYQFTDWMALGIGLGFERYSCDFNADESIATDYIMVAGRLLPLKQKEGASFTPYLVGGGGVHVHVLDPSWAGDLHLMGGVGGRIDLNKKPGGSAIDVQLVGLGTTPWSGQLRVGYSIQFSGKKKKIMNGTSVEDRVKAAASSTVEEEEAEAVKVKVGARDIDVDSTGEVAEGTISGISGRQMDPKALHFEEAFATGGYGEFKAGKFTVAQREVKAKEKEEIEEAEGGEEAETAGDEEETVEEGSEEATAKEKAKVEAKMEVKGKFDSYTLKKGDNLWRVASLKAVYGDPEMYPLLAEANPEYFSTPVDQRPGMTIRVPRGYSKTLAKQAREAAWSPYYTEKVKIRFSKKDYRNWKSQMIEALALADRIARPVGTPERYTVKEGESLSIISQRPGVYGKGKYWPLLLRANVDKINDPDLILSGTEIEIPKVAPLK